MNLPELGVGIVWWPPLDPLCRLEGGLVSVIEVEPEAFWIPNDVHGSAGFRSVLPEALAGLRQPVLLHGVGAPVGDVCPAPPGHELMFIAEMAQLHPPWVSEHLSFTRFRPTSNSVTFAGFLLPPLQSQQYVRLAVQTLRSRRDALGGAPMAFETGVNYLPPVPGEMPDGSFAAAIAEEADCGIVLDLHNLFCNMRNGRESVSQFCTTLPLDRVWELHLAGGQELAGFRLDAHSGLIEPELMEMAAELVPRLPNLGAIIFEIMPDFVPIVGISAIARQIERLHDLWHRRRCRVGNDVRLHARVEPLQDAVLDPGVWQSLLGAGVTGCAPPDLPGNIGIWWQSAQPALDLYRVLVQEARAGMLVTVLPRTIRRLLQERAPSGLRGLLAEFWGSTPASITAMGEVQAFVRFIQVQEPEIEGIAAALAADQKVLADASA